VFKWKDEFSVNIASIDEQHRKLFEIGSELDELTALNDGYDHYDEIVSILKKLKDYTVYHFGFEEKLLEKYNYDQLEAQCFEHHFFVKKRG
jgi:hemerythrin